MKIKNLLIAMALGLGLGTCMTSCGNAQMMSALTKGSQAFTVTNDQVAKYAAQTVVQMDAQNKVAPANSEYTKRLNRLVGDIETVGDTKLNFKVYLTNDINAFACADGSVRVYSGIMDLMTDEELLGIIGHEIGHVGLQHSTNAFKQQIINSALLDAIGATNSTLATLTSSQLGQLASTFMSSKFSRKQENEADDFGYDFLVYCGKNPYNMVLAFEKMLQLETSNGAQVTGSLANMFSSHPETTERIRRMKEKCAKDGYKK
ncbi:MAG: M48 family metallopeptidase [Muribaculaceae bacterium]|nr:M48 family metallopeptidase [Muribaculaceae bacterium]